ncbi:MAG TPA: oligosaccharide flippase family protein [Candidatus Acidoferrum sp.]|nr:oligosaccharide flippase family protein [Candidatus Acidoferrum sp.]
MAEAGTWNSAGVRRTRTLAVLVNACSSAGARVVMMAVGFFVTPYIVHTLSLQVYGLWSIVGAMASYVFVLDFVLGDAFVKFIVEYVERERRDAVRQVVVFGMLFYLLFGLTLAIPVWIATPWLVHLFKMPASEFSTGVLAFHLLVALFVGQLVFGPPGMVVTAMQRMDLTNRNNVMSFAASTAMTVVLLHAGWGIYGVIAGGYTDLVVSATLKYWTARRLFGPLLCDPRHLERDVIGRLFSFGSWTQLTALSNLINQDLPRLIAAGAVSVTSVGFFQLGSKVALTTRTFPGFFVDAILPVASAAAARDDSETVERLYRKGTVYAVIATCAVAGFFSGASELVMRVWMGPGYAEAAPVIIALCVGYVAASTTRIGVTVMRAEGRPKYEALFALLNAFVSLVVMITTVPRLGLPGIVIGIASGSVVGAIGFTIAYHRLVHRPWLTTVGIRCARVIALAAITSGLLYFVLATPLAAPLFASRIVGLLGLGLVVILYLLVFGGLVVLTSGEGSDENQLIQKILVRTRLFAAGALAR